MLRPSPNHGTQRLPNEDDDLGFVWIAVFLNLYKSSFPQIVIMAATMIIAPPQIKLRMPMRTEQFVELLCEVPLGSFLTPLLYNLLLIALCRFAQLLYYLT